MPIRFVKKIIPITFGQLNTKASIIILAATYDHVDADQKLEKACFGRYICPWNKMKDREACIANLVNLAYKDVTIGLHTDFKA